MEVEELEEGDILWPDHHHHHQNNNPCIVELPVPDDVAMQNNPTTEFKSVAVSAPIAIIPNSGGVYCRVDHPDADYNDNNERDYEATGGSSTTNRCCKKMVPPHVIVARRFADRMFSVCFGNGRTLRGRDLFTFRNNIFRMTGFIE